jgi:hypothetical protein
MGKEYWNAIAKMKFVFTLNIRIACFQSFGNLEIIRCGRFRDQDI